MSDLRERIIFLPETFTTLNEYIQAERGNLHKAAQIKREETLRVKLSCIGELPIEYYPVRIHFAWLCENNRSDPDNIAFAKKFILDGLVAAKVLRNDGWKEIESLSDGFSVAHGRPGVNVIITEVIR